jgi:hypothetical protein
MSIADSADYSADVDAAEADVSLLDIILSQLKLLEPAELFKVAKQALVEAEKRTKGSSKATAAAAAKAPSNRKSPHLASHRDWVKFTEDHANAHGWEAFVVTTHRKDKVTGEVTEEVVEWPASELRDGAWFFPDTDKQMNYTLAMSLSSARKAAGHPSYEEWLATQPPPSAEPSTTSSAKKVVVKLTAAEKEAAAAEKKAEKERIKAEAKAAKDAEKAEAKAAKEKAKAEAKAAKEKAKADAKAAKEAAKKPAAKAPVPAAAVKAAITAVKAAAVKAVVPAAAAPKPAAAVKPATSAAPKPAVANDWSCPEDGNVYPWSFKGKKYLRNYDNQVWLSAADGGLGEWQGVFIPATNTIDDSVPEPEYDDEE